MAIVDPFHRALNHILTEEVDGKMLALAMGSAADYPSYTRQIGYIEAMNVVLNKCQELETAHYGKSPGANKEQD